MPSIEELQILNHVLEKKDWTVIDENGLNEEHFVVHREPFEFIRDFKKQHGHVPTLETVMNRFEEFQRVELENVDVVVNALQEDWLHRQFRPIMKQAANLMGQKRTQEAIQELKIQTTNILKYVQTKGKGYSYIGKAEERKQKYLQIHGRKEDEILGYSTGFKTLDLITNGLVSGGEETDYFLVFAPSHMGKTTISSFMLMSGWNSTLDWDYPAYFALEQTAEEIARLWDNVLARVSHLALQRGTMSEEEKDRYIDFLDRLKNKKKDIIIYDLKANGGKPYTVAEIQRILESEGHNRFVLDQLSKVRLSHTFGVIGGDLRQRLFDVSAEVREMVLATQIPGFIVSQANRESARRVKKNLQNSEVTGEDVGESYSVYQDASKAVSIVKIDKNTFKLQVTKNRGNDCGQPFLVRYSFDTGLVTELNSEIGEQFF